GGSAGDLEVLELEGGLRGEAGESGTGYRDGEDRDVVQTDRRGLEAGLDLYVVLRGGRRRARGQADGDARSGQGPHQAVPPRGNRRARSAASFWRSWRSRFSTACRMERACCALMSGWSWKFSRSCLDLGPGCGRPCWDSSLGP